MLQPIIFENMEKFNARRDHGVNHPDRGWDWQQKKTSSSREKNSKEFSGGLFEVQQAPPSRIVHGEERGPTREDRPKISKI